MLPHCSRRRRISGTTSSSMAEPMVPLLVRVLAGNPVTGATILACLTTDSAAALRRLHPAVAVVVADVPWADTDTPVVNVVRWRAALPAAAVNWRPAKHVVARTLRRVAAALKGVPRLCLSLTQCDDATSNAILSLLPTSLHTLTVRMHCNLRIKASLKHLSALLSLTLHDVTRFPVHLLPPSLQELHAKHCDLLSPGAFRNMRALRSLSCLWGMCSFKDLAFLPPSLEELELGKAHDISGVSLAHLTRLRVLRVWKITIDDTLLASLPPCLETLYASFTSPTALPATASFVHLPALRTLDVSDSAIGKKSLASLPPSLVSLKLASCARLPATAVLPHLPALRVVDLSDTDVGNAMVASLPPGLQELYLVDCPRVTCAATLHHLPALRQLHSSGTHLSPAGLEACRARGCIAPADGVLRGSARGVFALVMLPDGRLACTHWGGAMEAWDPRRGGAATEVLPEREYVVYYTMTALLDGRGLAVGKGDTIEVWDVTYHRAPAVLRTTIACGQHVRALVALRDGRLAAGCYDGGILVVDVERGAIAAVIEGHEGSVWALVVMPDGRLASGGDDATICLWNTGTLECVATLTGHTGKVNILAVLASGQIASASADHTVRLWDMGARTSVVVLDPLMTGTRNFTALVPLPDGRLAAGCSTAGSGVGAPRPAARSARTPAVGAVPTVVLSWNAANALVGLPDGRLASVDHPYWELKPYESFATPEFVNLWLPVPPQPLSPVH